MLKEDSVLSMYLKDINKIPLLTHEEETELALKAAAGDNEAKKKIVNSNLRFVVNVAKKYQNHGLDLTDLISEGNIGLLTAIDRFDFSLLEAARDLGATKPQSMLKVLIPNVKSGIVTAFIFTFIPIFGAYTVPLLVGGKDSYMIGNVIVDQINKTRNWPLSASFSMIITVLSTAGVLWMMSSGKKENALKNSLKKA